MWFSRKSEEPSCHELLNQLETRVERLETREQDARVTQLELMEKVLTRLNARVRKREVDAEVVAETPGPQAPTNPLLFVRRAMRGY